MFLMQAMFVANLIFPTFSEEWNQELKTLRVGNVSPLAVLVKNHDEGRVVGVSLYRIRPSQSEAAWQWFARREERGGEMPISVQWADQRSCPALIDALIAIEAVPLPRIELRVAEPSSNRPPSLGPLHLTHEVWLRASDSNNSPVWLTMSSLGVGEPQRLFDKVDEQLNQCWAEGLAPA